MEPNIFIIIVRVNDTCTPYVKYEVRQIHTFFLTYILYNNHTHESTNCTHDSWDIIICALFADADTGIYPHAASQYHARTKTKGGIAMLRVDKFPYPVKQTKGNERIPYSNDVCHILKCFRNFKISAIPSIWSKYSYQHSVTRSHRNGKENGRRSESPLWRHQWHSFLYISHSEHVKHEIPVYAWGKF